MQIWKRRCFVYPSVLYVIHLRTSECMLAMCTCHLANLLPKVFGFCFVACLVDPNKGRKCGSVSVSGVVGVVCECVWVCGCGSVSVWVWVCECVCGSGL